MRRVLWGLVELLDVGRAQELGEDVGVRRGGSLGDQVGGGAGRGGRLAEGEEGLQRVESFGLLHSGSYVGVDQLL